MYTQIENDLLRYVKLTEEALASITARLTSRSLRKHEMLLNAGQVCQQVFFINQGCLRYFYLVDGEEKTGQFFFENDWYTDFASFISGQPSQENIQALENCELWTLSRQNLLELYDEHPKFERFGRLITEQAYMGVKSRNNAFLNESPEQRYLRLLRNRPKIAARIPQHYIASFLSIKPESLSRIRKRIADKR